MVDSIPYDIGKKGRLIVERHQTENIWLTGVQFKTKENSLIIERKLRWLKAGPACLQAATGGFIAGNLFRSLIGRHLGAGGYWRFHRGKPPFADRAPSWIFEAPAPGYEPASAKLVPFLSTTARPAPPRRVLSKMAATKSERQVFSRKKNSNAYRQAKAGRGGFNKTGLKDLSLNNLNKVLFSVRAIKRIVCLLYW